MNAQLYLHSPLSADDVLQYGMPHVAIATGANWRCDGAGRTHRLPLEFFSEGALVSPDALLVDGAAAVSVDGPVVIFDDDCFYMGSVLAEMLARAGRAVTFVTPEAQVSPWSKNTLEQGRVQRRLIELGVDIIPAMALAGRTKDRLEVSCVYSGKTRQIDCATLVPVTARLPDETLWHDLKAREAEWADAGIKTVVRLGDCLAPGLIAAAVYSGHEYARTYQEQIDRDCPPFLREDIAVLHDRLGGWNR
ncbi:Trimethylamine dehydrogenase [compost metagenome]